MIDLISRLEQYPSDSPIIIGKNFAIRCSDIKARMESLNFDIVPEGSTVAIVGSFEPTSMAAIIALLQKRCIIMPLTKDTILQHDYFLSVGRAEYVFEDGAIKNISKLEPYPEIDHLKQEQKPGLILFSSGTSGKPKAILHDMSRFLEKYASAQKSLKTIAFLLFDHIGGINTFFYALFAGGQIVVPEALDPESVFKAIEQYRAELLPTTPTFLRLALRTLDFEKLDKTSLKIVTYGTEVMDEVTLLRCNEVLGNCQIRQTYGMSELGILAIKTRANDSLFIKIGGNGVETKITEGILKIKSPQRMIGYLNAPSPFDSEGFYNTKDSVEVDGEWIRIIGRDSEIINIAGIKISPLEVEEASCRIDGVSEALAYAVSNPITGQHLELDIVLSGKAAITVLEIRKNLRKLLPESHQPSRVRIVSIIPRNHRFKRTGKQSVNESPNSK